jgi:hypothetical protein
MKYENSYLDALELLADGSIPAERAQLLEKVVGIQSLREPAQQKLVVCLAELGDLAGATRAYRRYADVLKQELNASPSPETVRVIEEAMRRGSMPKVSDGDTNADVCEPEGRFFPLSSIEPAGGAVSLDSKYYILRPVDRLFHQAMHRHDSTVLIQGGRQTGKTSLLARGLEAARKEGSRVLTTDLQTLNESHLSSLDALYLGIASAIIDQLDLDIDPQEGWSASRGPNINFERFLRRQILDKSEARLVWGIDEADRLFTFDGGSEVFGVFRSWHNRRSLEPGGPWGKLTLAIAYATEAHLFITDLNQSPFNVGTRLALEDFDLSQVSQLNERYGSPLPREDLAELLELINGHPYLVQRALQEIVARGATFGQIRQRAAFDEGVFGDHLRRILVSLARVPDLAHSLKRFINGDRDIPEAHFYRLRASGLMKGLTPVEAEVRCNLYRQYLSRCLT